ncbi:MAG: hypothetical protein V1648_00985 [Candidatus Aenigmatarchaeota archaeon]
MNEATREAMRNGNYIFVNEKKDDNFYRFLNAITNNPAAILRALDKYWNDAHEIDGKINQIQQEVGIKVEDLYVPSVAFTCIVPNLKEIGKVAERIKMDDFGYDAALTAARLRTVKDCVTSMKKKFGL